MNNSKITLATGEGMKKYDWLLTQLIRKVMKDYNNKHIFVNNWLVIHKTRNVH